MNAPTLLIRADASPAMGTGHVMRCLALAQWAAREGLPVRLIGRVTVPWVAEKLNKESISFTPLRGEIPSMQAPEELLAQLGPPTPDAWAVLDGYHFGLDCQKAVREAGYKLLLIDDYAHQPKYSCDILLNQNLGAEKLPYAGEIGKRLFGPKYALLRPEFAEARSLAEMRNFPDTPHKLLLTLGGGDFSEHLRRVASCFMLPELKGRILRVIAGAMQEEVIRDILQDCPAEIEILRRVDDMPALLLDTDLCITAGGSTCWELCWLGVPFLTVEVAENQKGIVEELCMARIAEHLSVESFRRYFHEPFHWKSAKENALNVTYGKWHKKIIDMLAIGT